MLWMTLGLALLVSQGAAVWKAGRLAAEGTPRPFWGQACASWAGGAMIVAMLAGFLLMHPPWYRQYPITRLDALCGKYFKAPKDRPDLKETYVYIRLTFTFALVSVVVGSAASALGATFGPRLLNK